MKPMSNPKSTSPTTRVGLRIFLRQRNGFRRSGGTGGTPSVTLTLDGVRGGESDTQVLAVGNPTSGGSEGAGAHRSPNEGLAVLPQPAAGHASSSQLTATPAQGANCQREPTLTVPPARFASPFRLCTVARQLMRFGQKKIAQGRGRTEVKKVNQPSGLIQQVKQELVEPELGNGGCDDNQVEVPAEPQGNAEADDPKEPPPEPSQMEGQELRCQLQECHVTLSPCDAEETMPIEGALEGGTVLSESENRRMSQRKKEPRMALNPATGKLHIVRSLDAQKRKRSQTVTTERKKPKKSSCRFCQREYADSTKLERHIEKSCRRNPSYPYKCEGGNCGMYFRCPSNFNRHKKSCDHLKPRPKHVLRKGGKLMWSCKTCDMKFGVRKDLRNHLCSGRSQKSLKMNTDSGGTCHTRGAEAKRQKMTASQESVPSSSNNCIEALDTDLGSDDSEDPVIEPNSDGDQGDGSPSPSQIQRWDLKACGVTLTRCDQNEIPVPVPVMKQCSIVLKRCDEDKGDDDKINKNEDLSVQAEQRRNIGKRRKEKKVNGRSSRRRFR